MDFTSIVGLLMGIGAVVGGAGLEGLPLSSITQPTAFIIVIGGSTGAVLLSYPAKDLMNALAGLSYIFLPSKDKPLAILEMINTFALKARKEGILALQADIKDITDPFLKKGLELMTDGTDPHVLRELLETELAHFEEEIASAAKAWEDFGAFTPTVGIIGAVLGLIHVMGNLNDPSKLGSGIAVAFVATVYGVAFANLIFIPLSKKMKAKAKSSIKAREMMIEGILSIIAGESPSFIQEKLKVFLSHAEVAKLSAENPQ